MSGFPLHTSVVVVLVVEVVTVVVFVVVVVSGHVSQTAGQFSCR
jgi:hypothetical protein